MKKILLLCITVAISLTSAGCASIALGSGQYVPVTSKPSQAKVVVYRTHKDNNKKEVKIAEAETPVTFRLRRGRGYFTGARYRLDISKEGYTTTSIHLRPRTHGWYWLGNYFTYGWVLGWLIIDPITGAMYMLSPKKVNAVLTRDLALGGDANADGIHIVSKEEIPEEVLERFELVRIDN